MMRLIGRHRSVFMQCSTCGPLKLNYHCDAAATSQQQSLANKVLASSRFVAAMEQKVLTQPISHFDEEARTVLLQLNANATAMTAAK
jgi:hypothetical protein